MSNKNKNVKIVFSGGSGRFGKVLRKIVSGYNVLYPKKNKIKHQEFKFNNKIFKKKKTKNLCSYGWTI